MQTFRVFKPFLFFVVTLMVISIACGRSTAIPTQQALMGEQGQTEPTNSTAPENISEPTKTPEPTNTPQPTNTPKPTNTPTPVPIGLSRSNPFPMTEVVSAPNWDVQVLEVKRGDEAWKDIQSANMFNMPAPEGMEYVLVKLHVKSTYADSDEHSIGRCDFNITGDRLIQYSCGTALVVGPEPQLDATLFTGGEAEGWVAFMVAQGEGNLILVVNEAMNFDDNRYRFIALDEGASISVSPELASIKPNDLGVEISNPAKISEKIITEDWEFTVLEAKRGDEVWAMVQEANQFNEPPADGMEYIAIKVHVRFIGTEDRAKSIDRIFFITTGNAGVIYDLPMVVEPAPALNCTVYPGGECEGWVITQAAVGETGVTLIFEPLFDFSGLNKRFISLEP